MMDIPTAKYFNRWGLEGVTITDMGLKGYVTLQPRIVPKTGNRNTHTRFHKSQLSIVERLINKVMVPGHKSKKHTKSSGDKTGKAITAMQIVHDALEVIETKTKENPIAVLVRAIENGAPREEVLTIEYGGARYPKAVECAPQRRVDIVLRYLTQGAYNKSFDGKKTIVQSLSDEILNAANMNVASMAISKKLEVERQADSGR